MKCFRYSLILVLLLCCHLSYGQIISHDPADYITVEDSIVLIKNATLIDGTGGEVRYNRDILVVNKQISAIHNTDEINIPEGALVIDGSGKTVIPGLVMMHEHLFHAKPFYGTYKAVHMPHTFPQMYLAGGVTTMRTAGSFEVNTDLNIKNLIDSGLRVGPDIDVSTPHIDREGYELLLPQLKSLYADESIENWLNYWFDKGVTSVKVYNNVSKADLAEILRVSHARNIKVTGHLCSIISFSGPYPLFKDTFEIAYGDRILELEIFEEVDNDKFIVSERLYYSYLNTNRIDADSLNLFLPESTLYTVWNVTDDQLKISAIDNFNHLSYVSYFTWHGAFDLSPFQENKEQIEVSQFLDDRIIHEYNNEFYAVNTEINGYTFDTLNLQMHGEPVAGDSGGNTCLYSKKHGIVRIINYGYWSFFGWDRVVL